MNWTILNHRTWLNLISTIILLVGLGSSGLIYQSVGNDPYGPLDFENSKLYRHNLEVYGGKFSVIMDDFRRWFPGLMARKISRILYWPGLHHYRLFGFFMRLITWHNPQNLSP